MGYDRGDSFPFNFESNGIPFGSKSKGKLSPRSYPIQFERIYSFLSVPGSFQLSHLTEIFMLNLSVYVEANRTSILKTNGKF